MMPFRVLLVDDEPHVLRALQRTFRNEPYQIFTATDTRGALEILDLEPIDLIITDQGMPGGSGMDLLRQVKVRYPWVLRMILTGRPGVGLAREAYQEAGAYRVLAKPYEPEHLRNLVRCAHHQLELQASREMLRRTLLHHDVRMRNDREDCPGLGRARRDAQGRLVFDDPVARDEESSEESGGES